MSFRSNLNQARYSVTGKLFFVGFLILLLLIPLLMVSNLVREREYRQNSVIEEIGESWGRQQTLAGPMLALPYRIFWQDDKGVTREKINLAWFLPDTLHIDARLEPETRRRGIFSAVVYRLLLEVSGEFAPPDVSQWKIPAADILWEEAMLSIALSDTRGIRGEPRLQWGAHSLEFLAGAGAGAYYQNGVHVRLPAPLDSAHAFQLSLEVNGNGRVQFVPVGKNTEVQLRSSWPDPSFSGEFLPLSRTVSATGFDAHWQISYLARNYPQQWRGDAFDDQLRQSAFGARLLIPVDFYQKSERAVKYGALFLLLTFLAFFLFEIFNNLRIHTLQYLLVGAALVIFFLLLLSLSEYLAFTFAYILAALAVIVLIGAYAAKILASRQRAWVLSLVLALLYAYLYVLLHLQDYALLLGSLGLFAILAAVMYLTRDVDWYAVSLGDKKE
jgi:inner membrane protein